MRNCVKLNGFVRNINTRKERNILTNKENLDLPCIDVLTCTRHNLTGCC